MTTKTTTTRHASIEIRLDIDDLDETHEVPNHINTVMFVPDVIIFYATGPDPDTMTSVRVNLIGLTPTKGVPGSFTGGRNVERAEWHFNDRHFPNRAGDRLLPRWAWNMLNDYDLGHLVQEQFVDWDDQSGSEPVKSTERELAIESLLADPAAMDYLRSASDGRGPQVRTARATAWDALFSDTAGPFSRHGFISGSAFTQWRLVVLRSGSLTILMAARGHGPAQSYSYVGAGVREIGLSHGAGATVGFKTLLNSLDHRAWDIPHTNQA